MRMMSPVLLGPEEFTAKGSVRISGITFPLPSGSMGGNVPVSGGTGATGPFSVMTKVRGFVNGVSGTSNWNGFFGVERAVVVIRQGQAASGGVSTPASAQARHLMRST